MHVHAGWRRACILKRSVRIVGLLISRPVITVLMCCLQAVTARESCRDSATHSVGQRARNPRTCVGVVVATERPTWRLQRGCSGELVCNDQVVKSHASLDDDGSPTNRQSNGPLQDPPLVHQHPERTLNCHSQRTMVEGENAFISTQIANIGS